MHFGRNRGDIFTGMCRDNIRQPRTRRSPANSIDDITSGVGGASIAAAIKTSQLYRKEKQIFEKMNSQLKELQK